MRRYGRPLAELGDEEQWGLRCYPIMAALVPTVTRRGTEVAYPGDPMCLYAALTLTIARSVAARRAPLPAEAALDDVVPDWGVLPDPEYRRSPDADGPRTTLVADNPTTDGKVFDPRVWDAAARARFRTELAAHRPRVLLLSAVSPAHRYALEMAAVARAVLPDCLIVLGGRHADETVRFGPGTGLAPIYSATAQVIRDGRAPAVVDFVVAGDGAPCLDYLLQAISLVVREDNQPDGVVECVADVLEVLVGDEPVGRGTIVCITADRDRVVPVNGERPSPADFPPSYRAFAIRARFGIFGGSESDPGRRTAHILTMNTCPFGCTFCSESRRVGGRASRFAPTETALVVDRVVELVDWGAEAVFFDDPVFWGGNWRAIELFSQQLGRRFARSTDGPPEWGCQLTVDVVLNSANMTAVTNTLRAMRNSGCTYVYIGIESMAEQVMSRVAKNLRRNSDPWAVKVRRALRTIRDCGIRVGSSILFGLDGEDRDSIDLTVREIGALLDDGLLVIASPNILTYHPATGITDGHGKEFLDYHSSRQNRPPYTYFEEAYPGVVSELLTEDDIWYIHNATRSRWGSGRNMRPEGA